jgi:hypothetical protein
LKEEFSPVKEVYNRSRIDRFSLSRLCSVASNASACMISPGFAFFAPVTQYRQRALHMPATSKQIFLKGISLSYLKVEITNLGFVLPPPHIARSNALSAHAICCLLRPRCGNTLHAVGAKPISRTTIGLTSLRCQVLFDYCKAASLELIVRTVKI